MKKIFILGMMMILVLISLVTASISFENGLKLTLSEIDDVEVGENLILFTNVYDANNGLIVNDSICDSQISRITPDYEVTLLEENFPHDGSIVLTINSTDMNKTGTYKAEIWCNQNSTKGGYATQEFDVLEKTRFGFWKPIEDWTFPVIYLIITFLIMGVAFAYESQILGVFGSIMMIMAYFVIGATSPILFAPLLIIGFLLGFKFATL